MNWSSLNWIDYTIIAVITVSTLISFARGFVREAISLIVWIAAIWIAYRYCHGFAETILVNMMQPGTPRIVVAFVILLIAVLLFGAFINFAFSHFIDRTGLSGIDRILGMAFGFARGILLVAVAILATEITNIPQQPAWQRAQLVPQFAGITQWLKSFVPEQFDKVKEEVVRGTLTRPRTTTPPENASSSPQLITPEVTIKLNPGVNTTIPTNTLPSAVPPSSRSIKPSQPTTPGMPDSTSTTSTTTYY